MSDEPANRRDGDDDDERDEERDEAESGTGKGRLVVHLHDADGKVLHTEATVLVMANVAVFAPQRRLVTKTGSVSGKFPAGDYSVQGVAAEHQVGRAFARLRPGEETEVVLSLPAGSLAPSPLADRLKVYGLDARKLDIQPLHVSRGETLVLDATQYRDRRSFTQLQPRNIGDVKRWVGTPDGVFGHDQPRFGPVPALAVKAGSAADVNRADAAAVRAIATEFVHGNSAAVSQYAPLLDTILIDRGSIVIAIFWFTEVTIDDGATLEIGRNSNVFACDVLHIHKNGTLAIVGDVRADIGSYEVFG